jgi:hypothetical protein
MSQDELTLARRIGGLNNVAISAAGSGNRDLVIDLIERGANDFAAIALAAVEGGYRDIVNDMVEAGATNL